jgi:hypothetical protein
VRSALVGLTRVGKRHHQSPPSQGCAGVGIQELRAQPILVSFKTAAQIFAATSDDVPIPCPLLEQAWADYIGQLREEATNVVPIRRAG